MSARWFFVRYFLLCCWQWCRLLPLALLPGMAWGQLPGTPPAFRFEKPKAHKVRVPFEFQRNLIIVAAHLNGKGPFNFLLDSGVGISLITDPALIELLGLRRGVSYNVVGVGEEKPLEAFASDSVRVQLHGVVAPAMSFLVLSADVLNLSGYVGVPVHGILGYDVFNSFAVQIDPVEIELFFHDPATYRPPRGRRWAPVPFDIEGRKSYLTTAVALTDSLTLPLKLILDTGAGHALSLETYSNPQLRVPAKRLQSQLGRGLSGAINGYLGRVQGIQLGRYRLRNLLTSFPNVESGALRAEVPRNGNIGFEMLKRFDVIIDYSRNTMWLRPNGLFRDPFEHDMCGIELVAAAPDYHRYFVLRIEPNSPAAEAGIQLDDELLSINLLPVKNMSLTQISRLFHSGDNRSMFLLLQRNGELVSTIVRLKRQI